MSNRGVTLVEIVAVVAILGSLLALSFIYINPVLQLNKIDDAKRKADISQIKSALDTYYNDHSCYPTTLIFGGEWSENGVVYMRKVPQDPNCAGDSSKCYVYKYSGSCPQWNVVFSKLTKPPATGTTCQLSSTCVPSDYSTGSWGCVVSGDTDCAHLTSSSLSSGSDLPGGGTSGNPTPTPSGPTATPTPLVCARDYACSGNPSRCNVVPVGTGVYCDPSYYSGILCNGVCQ